MFFAPPRAYSMYVLFGLFPPPPPSHLLLCLVFVLPPSLPRFPDPLFHLTNYGTPGFLAPLSLFSLPALLLLSRCLSSSSFAFTHPLGSLPPFSPPLFCPGFVAPKKWALANIPWRRRFDNFRDNLKCQLPTVLCLQSTRGY